VTIKSEPCHTQSEIKYSNTYLLNTSLYNRDHQHIVSPFKHRIR